MQRPRVWREVLMLFASFIRSPLFWFLQRSDPARSHRESLKKTQMVSPELLGLSSPDLQFSHLAITYPAHPPSSLRRAEKAPLGKIWAISGQKDLPQI